MTGCLSVPIFFVCCWCVLLSFLKSLLTLALLTMAAAVIFVPGQTMDESARVVKDSPWIWTALLAEVWRASKCRQPLTLAYSGKPLSSPNNIWPMIFRSLIQWTETRHPNKRRNQVSTWFTLTSDWLRMSAGTWDSSYQCIVLQSQKKPRIFF